MSSSSPCTYRTQSAKDPGRLILGVRGDFYNGLTTHREAEPRVGIAYNVKKTNTVLRVLLRASIGNSF